MDKWIPLTIVALVLSSIRVFAIIISSAGILLFSGAFQNQLLGNMIYYANAALHITILLLLAFFLNQAKESTWRSIAFIIYALMGLTFIVMGTLSVTDTQIWSAVSAVNILVIIFFTVQAFLVINNHLKSAFRWYSSLLLLIAVLSMGIPYAAYYFALPINYVQFTSIVYVLPAIVEIYLFYLFYQYFNRQFVNQYSNLESNL